MSDRPVAMREPGGPAGGMLCPVCGVALVMAEKQGVEIDYCPKCRGIWLDRGEIEKIVERSLEREMPRSDPRATPYPDRQSPQDYPPAQGWSERGHGSSHHGGHGGGYGKHGRRSWLRDLFD